MEINNPNSRIDIEPSLIRLNYLIQEGYTRRDIENMAGINPHTLRAILRGRTKKITLATHNKIKQLHSSYLIGKTDLLQEIEDDIKDLPNIEEEKDIIKNISVWFYVTVITFIMCVIMLIAVGRYIIGLFN